MTTAARPTDTALAEFRVPVPARAALHNILGGRGLTWRAGDTVLRPSAGDGETAWKADVLAGLTHSDGFRTPRPIRSRSGGWTVDGWEAWQWLPGHTDVTRVVDILAAGAAFHEAIVDLGRPSFIDAAHDPWATADRIAWDEEQRPEASDLRSRLTDAFRPVDAPSQIIHGDLLGNVMFEAGQPPTIIDWAPYWRPTGFAAAIVLADAACWHGLDAMAMRTFADDLPEGRQLLIRALVFRIATLEILGGWDAAMEARHAPIIDAALG